MKKPILALSLSLVLTLFFSFSTNSNAHLAAYSGQTFEGNNEIEIHYYKTERYFYDKSQRNVTENDVIVNENGERFAVFRSLSAVTSLIEKSQLDTQFAQKKLNTKIVYVLTEDPEKLAKDEPVKIKYDSISGKYSYLNQ